MQDTTLKLSRRIHTRQAVFVGVLVAGVLVLLTLAVTHGTWKAVAYGLVALFAFIFVLAVYFWGTMLFGGALGAARRRRMPVPWSFGSTEDIPEHDIDPGLELLAAGMLVYRYGEVRPRIHFRKVPLTNVRGIRPFVVARTGSERQYSFEFSLTDEADRKRFTDNFARYLTDAPQMITPPCRISLQIPKRLVGQRWNLQVRSGVTIVTSLRFMFTEARAETPDADVEALPEALRELLPRLLNEAVKHEAMTQTQEFVLEDYA